MSSGSFLSNLAPQLSVLSVGESKVLSFVPTIYDKDSPEGRSLQDCWFEIGVPAKNVVTVTPDRQPVVKDFYSNTNNYTEPSGTKTVYDVNTKFTIKRLDSSAYGKSWSEMLTPLFFVYPKDPGGRDENAIWENTDPSQHWLPVVFEALSTVTGVSLNKSEMSLTVGGNETLTATVEPYNAMDKTVKWSVSGTNAGAVKLYSDEACTTEVGEEATSTLTVYAKSSEGRLCQTLRHRHRPHSSHAGSGRRR